MKKIIAMICILALILTVTAPIVTINTFAAENPWEGWTITGNASVDGNVLKFISGSGFTEVDYKNVSLPDVYTFKFSARVNMVGSSMGIQGGNGVYRSGFYFTDYGGRHMDDAATPKVWPTFTYPNPVGVWHDYEIVVDNNKLEQEIYVDGELVSKEAIKQTGRGNFQFFCDPNGSYEVINFVITQPEGATEELKRTKGYTEPFFEDFYDLGGWRVESEPFVTHDAENGILHYYAEGDVGYRSIERPLTPTKNYDIEFRLKFPQIPKDWFEQFFWISLSTENAHTWMCLGEGRMIFLDRGMETFEGSPLNEKPKGTVYYNTVYDTWQTFKASIRDGYVTWYIDDKKMATVEMYTDNSVRWNAVALWNTTHEKDIVAFDLDWVKYTPYFDDELALEYPHNESKFVEGTDVVLQAKSLSGTEKIDYYVNNVLVGSGYKKDNYKYVLKNAKVGAYDVKARIGDIETAESRIWIEKLMKTEVAVNKTQIGVGEAVSVTANVETAGKTQVDRVEFLFNGDVYSTDKTAPYTASIKANEVGTMDIRAKVYSKTGHYVESESENVKVKYIEGKPLKMQREYEINYTYDGKSGNIDIKDGYFNLNLNHKGDTLTYKTTEGAEEYKGLKAGKYKMVVTAGYGEFYWNDQFVLSCRLPYMPTSTQSKAVSGVKNFDLNGSGVKTTYLSKKTDGSAMVDVANVRNKQHYSIEFDKTDSSPETVVFYDGSFRNELSFREDGIYAKRLLSTRFTSEPDFVKLTDKVEPGYYRITQNYGVAIVNLNNKPIGEYRAEMLAGLPRLTRTMTNPSATTFVAVKNSDEKFYHTDTFENITEFPSEEYWAPNNVHYTTGSTDKITHKLIKEKSGNHYMNISGTGTYILNAIDLNPTFKWRGMASEAKGRAYLMFRRSFADSNAKIGYDFDKQEWFIEMVTEQERTYTVAKKYAPNALKLGEWNNFELVANDYDIGLKMNGKEVLSGKLESAVKTLMYGRVGFGVHNGSYNFDDVVYEGKNRATAGLSFTTGGNFGQYNVSNTAAAFYKAPDGKIIATGFVNSLETSDNGKTWEKLILKASTDQQGRLFEEHMATMPNGTMVKVYPKYGGYSGNHYSQISKDGGKTWSERYVMSREEDETGATGCVSRLTCTKDGRLFFVTLSGNEHEAKNWIHYSDDGINWYDSETVLSTWETGVEHTESIVIDTPRKDEVWLFARSCTGFLTYFVSKDNGKTFDLTPHTTGLMHPASTFRVERDWREPETYYAIFLPESTDYAQRGIQWPRSRVGLAVSYDGMETWEYVTDLMEGSIWAYPTNTSDSGMAIIDDTIYWRSSSQYTPRAGTNFGSFDMTKIKPLKRMPQLHEKYLQGFDFSRHGAIEGCAIPKKDGIAWMYDGYYDAKVQDGRIDATTAERAFGITVKTTGTGAELVLGDGKIVVANGASSCIVNGEEKTFDREILKNGYLDIKALCEIYGKEFAEDENAFTIMPCNYYVRYQTMMDNMVK